MIKLTVFDFDGTLFDTREDIADAVNHARRQFGLSEHALDAVTSMVGYGVQELVSRAFADTPVDPAEALPVVMAYYSAHPSRKSRLYKGVRETLPLITATRTIVSNKPESLIWTMLREHDLTDHFAFVSGGETFARRKPDPEAIEFLEERFRVRPREILVVGDHAPDIEMAKAAGTWSVFCRYGFIGHDVVGADFEVDEFSELPGVIGAIN